MGRAVISAGSIQGFRYGLKAYSTDGDPSQIRQFCSCVFQKVSGRSLMCSGRDLSYLFNIPGQGPSLCHCEGRFLPEAIPK